MKKRKRKIRKSIKFFLWGSVILAGFFLYRKYTGSVLRWTINDYWNDIRESFGWGSDDCYLAQNIYVYNISDERVEYAKNAKQRVSPASLTKMLTSYVVLQQVADISDLCPVNREVYLAMVESNASMSGFYGDEQTSYRDLLYGTILASGGESAASLAIQVGGDIPGFSELMNQTASAIGMKNSHFSNPEGLDDDDLYSTAEDLGKLLRVALQDADFRAIFTRERYQSTSTAEHPDGISVVSTVLGKLHDYPQEGFTILGGKSGTTGNAGLCWATLAEKNGKEYIVIVMGIPFEDISDPGDAQIRETLQLLAEL